MNLRHAEPEVSVGSSTVRTMHALIVVMGLVVFLIGMPLGRADQVVNPLSSGGMQSGIVTQVLEHTVVIDGREYGFSPKVMVLDHEGNKAELSYITRKSEVNFRVMKDDIQKIEKIIVHHPE